MNLKLVNFTHNVFNNLLLHISSEKELIQWAGSTHFTWPLDEIQLTRYLALTEGMQPQAYIFKAIDEQTGTIVGISN